MNVLVVNEGRYIMEDISESGSTTILNEATVLHELNGVNISHKCLPNECRLSVHTYQANRITIVLRNSCDKLVNGIYYVTVDAICCKICPHSHRLLGHTHWSAQMAWHFAQM